MTSTVSYRRTEIGLASLWLITTAGSPGSLLVIPVAAFEIILMPFWLYAKGFNRQLIVAVPPLMNAA